MGVITKNENLLDFLVKEAVIDAHTATKTGMFGESVDYTARAAARKELRELAGYDKKANITIIQNPKVSIDKDGLNNI